MWVKKITNHPPVITINSWYKPLPVMGGLSFYHVLPTWKHICFIVFPEKNRHDLLIRSPFLVLEGDKPTWLLDTRTSRTKACIYWIYLEKKQYIVWLFAIYIGKTDGIPVNPSSAAVILHRQDDLTVLRVWNFTGSYSMDRSCQPPKSTVMKCGSQVCNPRINEKRRGPVVVTLGSV